MINEIQRIIKKLKVEKEKANESCNLFTKNYNYEFAHQRAGKVEAFSFCIQELTFLLNSERENGGEINGQTAENCGNAHVVGSMPKSADSSG
jgi:hypothetical protein